MRQQQTASISITNMSLVTIQAEKKILDDRPDSWASFPHKDRGVKYHAQGLTDSNWTIYNLIPDIKALKTMPCH